MRNLLLLALCAASTAHGSLFGKSDKPAAPSFEEGWEHVTAGSTIKLAHVKTDARLTMPQVSYGTGSQQQAITAHKDAFSTKGFWRVEVEGAERGVPVECGRAVRLINSDSDHSLHSHAAHKSPISGQQEVSGFDGRDAGDMWTVECSGTWRRESPVLLRHVDTGKYLVSLPNKKYHQPISGHIEVSAAKKADSNAHWMALEGFYFKAPSAKYS
ncbi:hypothetical protein LPJ78_000914 [Coemansia sp. RSA 989]|nr:mannosyltransferase [Coemansia mojavensis]KAJ1743680.1 hypothetical protein LPJ68_000737 [Coemansia sp. RSA 1086]KAJ1867504.1 hypothetical protein LPJ78_000914 [Coemansia sp. RSA 989]KAJ1875764.1 hypothetical protein LPJ55_000390 [Coemansia sp. RSA 990]KAJ2650998.1 hypothetical protein IWW40_002017 [Coemansia sp. RSA 1250]KAJ2673514.1 hypothetical protein IWW42_002237 [Coemansia sp. RSA 1085]